MKNKSNKVRLSGFEAHMLLYAFDAFYPSNQQGQVLPPLTQVRMQFTQDELQAVRDKLFKAHEHGRGR